MILRGNLRNVVYCAWLLAAPAVHADLDVGASGVVSLASGAMDLGCTDITVTGLSRLNLDSAAITGVRNVSIQPGGIVDFGTGSIEFAGAFVSSSGQLQNLGPNSLRPVVNLACAANGPSIVGVTLPTIPTLNFWGLSLLAFALGGCGILLSRRRRARIEEWEQSHATRS